MGGGCTRDPGSEASVCETPGRIEILRLDVARLAAAIEAVAVVTSVVC